MNILNFFKQKTDCASQYITGMVGATRFRFPNPHYLGCGVRTTMPENRPATFSAWVKYMRRVNDCRVCDPMLEKRVDNQRITIRS